MTNREFRDSVGALEDRLLKIVIEYKELARSPRPRIGDRRLGGISRTSGSGVGEPRDIGGLKRRSGGGG
eukprot:2001185-Karenia_brevis.AAC.1